MKFNIKLTIEKSLIIALASVLMLCGFKLNSGKADKEKFHDNDYTAVAEVIPSIVGGVNALSKQIKYPPEAKIRKVSGKVLALVYINENGDVDKVTIIKGVETALDEAVAEGIKKCKFNPGMNKGVCIKTKLALKVSVEL